MKPISRRGFLASASKATVAAIAVSQIPSLVSAAGIVQMPLGVQSWSVKDTLDKDLQGTLKRIAGLGYSRIEMCYPKGYAGIGFGTIAKMPASALRKTIEDAGMGCFSCHFGFGDLAEDHLGESIAFAREMGLTQMICSTFWLPGTATLKDYQEAAAKLNLAAEKIKEAGMQTGFHNHEFEFHILEGALIYDVLMKSFDPALVKMQFQTEVINLGYQAAEYFNKYPGRFLSAHLSDWTADKKEVPIGKGIIDWRKFFAAAKTGGVENIFVEMSPETFRDSAIYLKSL